MVNRAPASEVADSDLDVCAVPRLAAVRVNVDHWRLTIEQHTAGIDRAIINYCLPCSNGKKLTAGKSHINIIAAYAGNNAPVVAAQSVFHPHYITDAELFGIIKRHPAIVRADNGSKHRRIINDFGGKIPVVGFHGCKCCLSHRGKSWRIMRGAKSAVYCRPAHKQISLHCRIVIYRRVDSGFVSRKAHGRGNVAIICLVECEIFSVTGNSDVWRCFRYAQQFAKNCPGRVEMSLRLGLEICRVIIYRNDTGRPNQRSATDYADFVFFENNGFDCATGANIIKLYVTDSVMAPLKSGSPEAGMKTFLMPPCHISIPAAVNLTPSTVSPTSMSVLKSLPVIWSAVMSAALIWVTLVAAAAPNPLLLPHLSTALAQ